MDELRTLSETIKEFPEFEKNIEWNQTPGYIIENKNIGSISHGVIHRNGKPLYDLPVFEFHDSVMTIPYTLQEGRINKILVIFSERPVSGLTLLEFPGGYVEKGESVEEAAKRELAEETGNGSVQVAALGKLVLERAFAKKPETHVCGVFLSDTDARALDLDSRENKVTSKQFVTPEELDGMIMKGKIFCGISLAAWSLFKAANKERFD